MMPQEAVSHSVLRPPCLELGPCMLQLETRVGMWSLELIRATKRKNDPNDSRHCQCGREGKRLEPHCRTGIRKVCASFLYSRSRTLPEGPRGSPRPLLGKQSVNPAAPAAWAWPSLRSCLLTVAQGPFHGEFPCSQRTVEQPL